jgi:hypothetical protein
MTKNSGDHNVWLDEERSVRSTMAEVGLVSPDQLKSFGGLEFWVLTSTTGPVRALGKVIHSGKSTAIAEGRIQDTDGTLYAHCTTTCLLFPMA